MNVLSKSIAAVRSLFGISSDLEPDELNLPQTEGEQKAAITHAPPGWAWVKATDESGRIVYERWEFTPQSTRIEKNGFEALNGYIGRLIESQHWFSSIGATSLDEESYMSVWKMEGQMQVHLSFSPGEKDREKTARALFKERSYSVKDDYTTDDKARILSWTVPADSGAIIAVLVDVAQRVYGMRMADGLDVSYQDHRDERNEHDGACSFYYTHPIEDPNASEPPQN